MTRLYFGVYAQRLISFLMAYVMMFKYYRPLYNLEQVELLRGPNALFFGRWRYGRAS